MTKYQIFKHGAGAKSRTVISSSLEMIPHERAEWDGETVVYFWSDADIEDIKAVCDRFKSMNGQIDLIGCSAVMGRTTASGRWEDEDVFPLQ